MKDYHRKNIRLFKTRRAMGVEKLRRGKTPDPPKPFETNAWRKPLGFFVAGVSIAMVYYSLTLNIPFS